MPLIFLYESKRKERKLRNKTAKQTREYDRKLLSEDEEFCISRSRSFPLLSEQSKVFHLLFQGCLQNCNASARAGLLGAVQYFRWEHNTAQGKGGDRGTKHPALLEFKASEQPQTKSFGLTQTKDCSSLWRRTERLRNTTILLLQQRTVPCLPKAHLGLGYCSLMYTLSTVYQTLMVLHQGRKLLQRQTIAQ